MIIADLLWCYFMLGVAAVPVAVVALLERKDKR